MGISEATFAGWKTPCGCVRHSEVGWLRLLEEESRKLKQIVADLSLDKVGLQAVIAKKLRGPPATRAGVRAYAAIRLQPAPSVACPAHVGFDLSVRLSTRGRERMEVAHQGDHVHQRAPRLI